VCLDVAREAMQMHTSGAPIASIRTAIETTYRPQFPTMTPTPPIESPK
jgi:hypothetical protein